MNGWLIAYLVLSAMGFGYAVARDGQTMKVTMWGTLLGKTLMIGLLYMGGAFS